MNECSRCDIEHERGNCDACALCSSLGCVDLQCQAKRLATERGEALDGRSYGDMLTLKMAEATR